MSESITVLICLLLAGLRATNGHTKPSLDLTLLATFTRLPVHLPASAYLNIRCNYTGLSTLSFLGIGKRPDCCSTTENLAFITPEDRDTVIREPGLASSALVQGQLNKGADASPFLSISIPDPGADNSSTYICIARTYAQAFNYFSGHDSPNFEHWKSVKVEVTSTNNEDLANRIAALEEGYLDLMESNVDLKENILDLQKRVAQLECNKAKQDAKVSILHNALFIASDAYNGHHYYLTQHQPTSYTNAEKVCNAMGGYLAEVDTVTEFRFIQAFLRRKIKSSQIILLGGTDANSEGTFINPNSSTQGYSEWYRNQPDNSGYKEHCRSIMESLGHDIGKYLMNDIPCDIVNDNFYKHGYLCEVPSTVDVRQETCEF